MITQRLAANAAGIARAAGMLRAGDLVAFGTETVYGLGGDATNGAAVAAIFAAKGRPHFNPLICHYPNATAAFAHVQANPAARLIANALWPGPITLILPRAPNCPVHDLASAGLATLAVRVPATSAALALLHALARPIAAPSANRSGHVSPTTADHVLADLAGKITAVLDSGPTMVGLESTVLDLSGSTPILRRPGGITLETLRDLIGDIAIADVHSAVVSPGMLPSHYAPSLPVRLNAARPNPNEAWLAFGPQSITAPIMANLSARGDVTEAAQNLFAALRLLDAQGSAAGMRAIAVSPVPHAGLGVAINDRLARAAYPKTLP